MVRVLGDSNQAENKASFEQISTARHSEAGVVSVEERERLARRILSRRGVCGEPTLWGDRAGYGRAGQAFGLSGYRRGHRATAYSSLWTATGHNQDDQVGKANPRLARTLKILDRPRGRREPAYRGPGLERPGIITLVEGSRRSRLITPNATYFTSNTQSNCDVAIQSSPFGLIRVLVFH